MDQQEKGGFASDPPTIGELGSALGAVCLAFWEAWPPAELVVPHVDGGTREREDHEQLVYYRARDAVLVDEVFAFVAASTKLSAAEVEIEADQAMERIRVCAEGALKEILKSRG